MKSISLVEAGGWKDYDLLDSGDFYKLERFGQQVLARPEPQAVWQPTLSASEWQQKADVQFKRSKENPEKGEWQAKKGVSENWRISYALRQHTLRFLLTRTAFKHIGLFPEQASNWEWVYDQVEACAVSASPAIVPRVLNLFAYTGGVSLAACAAGAEVTHVDSVRKVIDWGRQNMEASDLTGIRWVVEDAAAFVRREAKRGNLYHGIVLDPPAYGRGPAGEKWILEEQINDLLKDCARILHPGGFVALNLYSMGLSAVVAKTLLFQHFQREAELVELVAYDATGKGLPFGTVARLSLSTT